MASPLPQNSRPEPVADEPPPVLLPAADVPGDLSFEDDRLRRERLVAEDPLPVSVERLAVPSGEVGHARGLGIPLVLEEDREVGLDYVTKQAHKRLSRARPGAPVSDFRCGAV